MNLSELLLLRDKLWSQVRELPGVVTIGIGSSKNQDALVVFVDETKVQTNDLPVEYANVPVVLKPAGRATGQAST
jgi:hypothetical protein